MTLSLQSSFSLLASVAFLTLVGCQSASLVDRYFQVEMGSTKGEVLDLMGSPRQATRENGMDNWYYDLRPHRKRRVLIFDSGVLLYKGPIIPPPITAAQEDQIREPQKKLSPRAKNYKRPQTDKELREILRKEVEKKTPKKAPKFEKI